jgi:hypothetical protein
MRLVPSDYHTLCQPSRCGLRVHLKHQGEHEIEPSPFISSRPVVTGALAKGKEASDLCAHPPIFSRLVSQWQMLGCLCKLDRAPIGRGARGRT